MLIAVSSLVGFFASAVLTRLVWVVSQRLRLFDIPNDRSSHSRPTPRMGGLGIAAGCIIAFGLSGAIADWRQVAVVAGGIAMAGVGLIDDLRHMRAGPKLLMQVIVASVIAAVLQPDVVVDFPGPSLTLSSWAAQIAAIIWIVAVCNVVNFMDGIDGLVAASIAVAALAASVVVGNNGSAVFLALAAGATGFLIWNWHPASIFMGDSGSQFLGFVFAAGLLLPADGISVVPGLLLLAPLLLDAGVTLIARAIHRDRLFQAHRGHVYQRLADSYGQARVAAAFALMGVGSGLAAIVYITADDPAKSVIVAIALVAVLGTVTVRRTGGIR